MNQKYLVIIGGPTAVGKTSMAIRLANYFGIEILSADSRQLYKEMNIGTAKPTQVELNQAPHHFINHLSVQDTYSVGDYEKEVLNKLEELFEGYDAAILVGGSGMFLRAIMEGLDEFPTVPPSIKEKWIQQFEKEGIEALQIILEQQDPTYFYEVDIHNPHRLIRALSVMEVSGQPFSSFRQHSIKTRPFVSIPILLEMDRTQLYGRINKRVDIMIAEGLLEEARQLHPFRALNALQTVGYEELFQHFEGKLSLEEAIELIKRNTRRYAKRQLTWFRKRKHWNTFAYDDLLGVEQFLKQQFLGT